METFYLNRLVSLLLFLALSLYPPNKEERAICALSHLLLLIFSMFALLSKKEAKIQIMILFLMPSNSLYSI